MIRIIFVILLLNATIQVNGQNAADIPFDVLGTIQPRSSLEISSNNWAIGAETMDRDLVDFASWKDHLAPLGAKKIRLQGGWAKCEPEKGVYRFEWLDEIIDHVLEQGVEPWFQTSYGNPIYEGGGGIHLSAGFPTSDTALAAWDNWVRATATRYQERVKIWEVWNEPDNKGKNSAEDYAHFYIRTAEIIRSIIPDATLYALSLASIGERGQAYTDTFLQVLKQQDKLHLVDEITLHGYTYNPSDVYPSYEKMHQIVSRYSDQITLRQGELGCPSENQEVYALRNYPWTELSQAKWVVRKMMGDLGRDIPSSYFLIIDIVYTHDHEELMDTPKRNTKGLIKSSLDREFVALKQSYAAYQHVTAIFDHRLKRIPQYPYTVDSDSSLSLFTYRADYSGQQAVAIWMDGQTPTNSNAKTPMTFTFPTGQFNIPVLVDLRTGEVYEIPSSSWKKSGTNYTFSDIPIYDSPILIAEKNLIPFANKNQ
ncbi:MAG: beta-galactosidase [Bacteroidota bacterium]